MFKIVSISVTHFYSTTWSQFIFFAVAGERRHPMGGPRRGIRRWGGQRWCRWDGGWPPHGVLQSVQRWWRTIVLRFMPLVIPHPLPEPTTTWNSQRRVDLPSLHGKGYLVSRLVWKSDSCIFLMYSAVIFLSRIFNWMCFYFLLL